MRSFGTNLLLPKTPRTAETRLERGREDGGLLAKQQTRFQPVTTVSANRLGSGRFVPNLHKLTHPHPRCLQPCRQMAEMSSTPKQGGHAPPRGVCSIAEHNWGTETRQPRLASPLFDAEVINVPRYRLELDRQTVSDMCPLAGAEKATACESVSHCTAENYDHRKNGNFSTVVCLCMPLSSCSPNSVTLSEIR